MQLLLHFRAQTDELFVVFLKEQRRFAQQLDVVDLIEGHVLFDDKLVGTFDDQHVSYPAGRTPLHNGSSTGLVGGFELVGFGFHDWHPSKAVFDLYYDDIVLDTKRVNCLP